MAPKAAPKSIGRGKAATVRPGGSGVKAPRPSTGERASPALRAGASLALGSSSASNAPASAPATRAGHLDRPASPSAKEAATPEAATSALADLLASEHAPAEPSGRPALDATALQEADLAMAATPLSRHTFRATFSHVEGSSKLEKPALRYVLFVPKLHTHEFNGRPGYSDHRIKVSGSSIRGAAIETFDFEHFLVANVPANALPSLKVEHSFVSHRVRLGTRTGTDELPVPTLTPGDRLSALADDADRADKMRSILVELGLERHSGERDIAYAARLGKALNSSDFVYDARATEDALHLLPTLVFELHKGDCSAFNAGFVYALRSQGVPAHVSLGLKYGREVSEACGAFAASHAQSEFFAEGVGWVQCDATGGVTSFEDNSSSAGSFVGWHSVTPSLSEAREAADVLRSASSDIESSITRIRKLSARRGLSASEPAQLSDLAAVLTTALSISSDAAERRAKEVAAFCGQTSDISLDVFCDGFAALQLGRCPVHFGTGKGLCATAMAGAALFAGGPYERGVPLDVDELEETAIVVAGHERVTAAVGGAASSDEGGPRGGFFRVEYEFSDEPVV